MSLVWMSDVLASIREGWFLSVNRPWLIIMVSFTSCLRVAKDWQLFTWWIYCFFYYHFLTKEVHQYHRESRKLITLFKKSPIKNDFFQVYINQEPQKNWKLKLNCKTRWSVEGLCHQDSDPITAETTLKFTTGIKPGPILEKGHREASYLLNISIDVLERLS